MDDFFYSLYLTFGPNLEGLWVIAFSPFVCWLAAMWFQRDT